MSCKIKLFVFLRCQKSPTILTVQLIPHKPSLVVGFQCAIVMPKSKNCSWQPGMSPHTVLRTVKKKQLLYARMHPLPTRKKRASRGDIFRLLFARSKLLYYVVSFRSKYNKYSPQPVQCCQPRGGWPRML